MHKPANIRNMFAELIEDGETSEVFFGYDKRARFAEMVTDEQLQWLSEQLWNCTDCMPSSLCATLDMPVGSSYMQAAQLIRQGYATRALGRGPSLLERLRPFVQTLCV